MVPGTISFPKTGDENRGHHVTLVLFRKTWWPVPGLPNGIILPAPDLFEQEVVRFVLLMEAAG